LQHTSKPRGMSRIVSPAMLILDRCLHQRGNCSRWSLPSKGDIEWGAGD